MYNHIRIKESAKACYRENSGISIGAIIVYFLVSGYFVSIFCNAMYSRTIFDYSSNYYSFENSIKSDLLSMLYFVIFVFLGTVAQVGLCRWFVKSIRGEKPQIKEMFTPFKEYYWGAVGVVLLKYLFIVLWSFLFCIPGIVKYFSYYMAEYIKADNPCIPADRAIDMSKIMTKGHKGDLFYLNLSFIGWFLLSTVTCGILYIVYVFPYYFYANAQAYEVLKAEAISLGKLSADEFGMDSSFDNNAFNNNQYNNQQYGGNQYNTYNSQYGQSFQQQNNVSEQPSEQRVKQSTDMDSLKTPDYYNINDNKDFFDKN